MELADAGYIKTRGAGPETVASGDEVLWEIDEHAWFFIEPNAARTGAAA
jgi:hypothetical protein